MDAARRRVGRVMGVMGRREGVVCRVSRVTVTVTVTAADDVGDGVRRAPRCVRVSFRVRAVLACGSPVRFGLVWSGLVGSC